MAVSRGVENANAIVGIVLTLLPWFLRIFGVDVGETAGLVSSGTGVYLAANAKPTWRA